MLKQGKTDSTKKQISVVNLPRSSEFLNKKIDLYLKDILESLNSQIDKRLVRTFRSLFIVILTFRNRSTGLVLSELGSFLCSPAKAPAGTKRISNLLRSKKWTAFLIDRFLFERTKKRIEQLTQKRKMVLFLWDDSCLEKSESWFSEGLCSVRSSKAKRLTKIKRGFYNTFKNNICVPGYKWTGILVSAVGEVPSVCQMTWWTNRGKFKEQGTNIIYRMLDKLSKNIDLQVTHVFDRGYASAQMLEWLFKFKQDFIIRWKKNHLLIMQTGLIKKTHLVARSYKAKASKLVWDKNRKKQKRITIVWAPVKHPEFPDNELYLIIIRDVNKVDAPIYILTSQRIESVIDAWQIAFAYMHRWAIEQAFRFCKSELAIESARLWFFENRLKLLGIVSLVLDFLLMLIGKWRTWVMCFMTNWCHRTGNRYREASIPIYRLRIAISYLLNCIWVLANWM